MVDGLRELVGELRVLQVPPDLNHLLLRVREIAFRVPSECRDLGRMLDGNRGSAEDISEIVGHVVGKCNRTDKVRPEAIEAKWTQDILKERGLKAPIGEVKALPASQAPKL